MVMKSMIMFVMMPSLHSKKHNAIFVKAMPIDELTTEQSNRSVSL